MALVEANRIVLVVGWKSDVNPDAATQAAYVAQLRDYLRLGRKLGRRTSQRDDTESGTSSESAPVRASASCASRL